MKPLQNAEPDFRDDDPGLGTLVNEFVQDRKAIELRYPMQLSNLRIGRLKKLHMTWRQRLEGIEPAPLSTVAAIDRALFLNFLQKADDELEHLEEELERLKPNMPYAELICQLDAERMDMKDPSGEDVAAKFAELSRILAASSPVENTWIAGEAVKELKQAIERWRDYYCPYDPEIAWWVRTPIEHVLEAFEAVQPKSNPDLIPGRPVGRQAIEVALKREMLANTPEELVAIGEREYAWCLREIKGAARELGFGEDWRAAIEHVKDSCVSPGQQPRMVRQLALEAVEIVRDLVTVPPLAEETWRMNMMTAEAQKVSPFFLGGEVIMVSYPTDAMSQEEKRMSMRGNNPAFSRATVQHELIPGHHLQQFMTRRFRPYRRLFSTPFWIEGWTIYWELLLWELGFPDTPERRIGMLFWRMHRCIRVVFSLRFHLGEISTADCVEMLVDLVGHERFNAEAEVRRSFNGSYPPLYQAAYLLGGLQFREISRELLEDGWKLRDIHDRILRENQMPPAMLRLALTGDRPSGGIPAWRLPVTGSN